MIDPSIALRVNTTQGEFDPLEQYGKIAGIRNLIAQRPIQEAQLEKLKLDNEQTKLENAGLPAKQEAAAEAAKLAQRKADLEAEDKTLDLGIKKAGRLASLAGSVKDDASKDYALGQAIREGVLDKEHGIPLLMHTYDTIKPALSQFTEQAMTATQQAEERRKAIKDEYEKFDNDQKKLLAPLVLRENAAKALSEEQRTTGQVPRTLHEQSMENIAKTNAENNVGQYELELRAAKGDNAARLALQADAARKMQIAAAGRTLSNDRTLDREIAQYGKPFDDTVKGVDSQLDKILDAEKMISGGAIEQALGVPKILTALVSGQGSGVRITKAELDSIAHARGLTGDVEGFFNKISGNGTLTKAQKEQMQGILGDVRNRIIQKKMVARSTSDAIASASTRDEILAAKKKGESELDKLTPTAAPGDLSGLSTEELFKRLNGGK